LKYTFTIETDWKLEEDCNYELVNQFKIQNQIENRQTGISESVKKVSVFILYTSVAGRTR